MIEIFITFAAFMLAFFSLINRVIIFRLNMGVLSMRRLFWLLCLLGCISLVNIPVSYFIISDDGILQNTLIHYGQLPHINYARYIDGTVKFLWNTTFVTLILYLFYKLITPVKFSQKKSKIYFEECGIIIASGIEADIQKLAAEISYSITLIFDHAFKEKNTDTEQYAASLIDLFSDEFLCKKIVNHHPATLYTIFDTVINNCDKYEPLGKMLINRLILLMFIEPESQLNREDPYHGLGKFGTFKKLIFGNIDFLRSSYRPLSHFFVFNKSDFNAECIDKYFEIIEFSLEKYLNHRDNSPDIFYAAFDVIGEIVRKNILSLKQIPDAEMRFSPSYVNLISCSAGMNKIVHFIRYHSTDFPNPHNIKCDEYNYFKNDRNIHGAIAHGVYKIIEELSTNNHNYDGIRLLLVEIYELFNDSTPLALSALQARLDILLAHKIEENLTKLYFPEVTASLIYAFGLYEPEQAKLKIHKVLLTQLKQHYLSAYNSNPEVAIDMLPKDTKIDVSLKKLIRKNPFQWLRYKIIEELSLEE